MLLCSLWIIYIQGQFRDKDITRYRSSVPPSCPRSLNVQPSPEGQAQRGLAAQCLIWLRPCPRDTEDGVVAPPEAADATDHTWRSPVLGWHEPRQERPWLPLPQSEVWQYVPSGRSPSPQHPFYLKNTRYYVSQGEDVLRSSPRLCAGGDFLPSFSTGEVVGWLALGTDWVHFTRSAQLGPVWESRAAASVGGGPLNKTNTHHCMRTNKCAHVQRSLYCQQVGFSILLRHYI